MRERVGLERREHEIACKFLAQVENMRTAGADRECTIAHRLELAPLPEIHRHRHDFGAVVLPEPGTGDGRLQPA